MSEPIWTVLTTEKNMDVESPTWDSMRPTLFEHYLCFEGRKCHMLTGDNGKSILTKIAEEFNAKDYRPKFVNGKMVHEMSMKEKLKSAQDWTQELPL